MMRAVLQALSIPQILDHLPQLFPSLCIKFRHPGFFVGMVFKSEKFVTFILVVHMQYSLTEHVNKGKPLYDLVSSKEILGVVTMNGHLTEGAKCYVFV